MYNPPISVILPYYNASETLKRAIDSILKQSYDGFQLFLIDNNSTDGSAEIAEKYRDKDPRIVLLEEKEQGVTHAFNRALATVKTKYIARMDADDYALPDRLLYQKNYLEKNPGVGLLGGKVQLPDGGGAGFQHYIDWSNKVITPKDILLNQFVELPIINPTLMGRAKVWRRLHGYRNGDFPEDYDLILRAMAVGIKIHKLDDYVLDWFDSENRLTRTDSRYSIEAFYKLKASFILNWLQKNDTSHCDFWICGGGKLARRRSAFLLESGLKIKGYVDIKKRNLSRPCIRYDDIPNPGNTFIISFVSNRGKREEVRRHLVNKSYKEGVDFILAA